MSTYNKPTNNKTQGCDDYTSKCVIWDGPNIVLNCFKTSIVKGQSVESAVVQSYNLLCKILQQINLEGINLDCLLQVSGTAVSIREVFDYIINKLCTVKDTIDSFAIPEFEIRADLPFCLQFEIPQGTVTKLEISEYYELVAAKICGILAEIANINTTFDPIAINNELTAIENQINALCNTVNAGVTPTCTNNVVLNPTGGPVKVQTAFEWLEKAFCSFINFTGTRDQLLQAISYDCPNLGNLPKLNGTGDMNQYFGWENTPGNLAESINNLWITICDMRAAMRKVLDTCCDTPCNNLTFGYQLVTLPNNAGYELIVSSIATIRSHPLYRGNNVTSIGPAFPTPVYSFNDPLANFPPGGLVGYKVRIVSGTGVFQTAPIVFNTATQITLSLLNTNWILPIDATSFYEVYDEFNGNTPMPTWVNEIFPDGTNVIITLNDGSANYTFDTGNNAIYWINGLFSGGIITVPMPVGFDPTSPFKTITISYTIKYTNPIVSAVAAAGVITYTTKLDHPYLVGNQVDITGVDPVGFNFTNAIVTSTPAPNQFTIADPFAGTYNGGGGVILSSKDCIFCECCCNVSLTDGIY